MNPELLEARVAELEAKVAGMRAAIELSIDILRDAIETKPEHGRGKQPADDGFYEYFKSVADSSAGLGRP